MQKKDILLWIFFLIILISQSVTMIIMIHRMKQNKIIYRQLELLIMKQLNMSWISMVGIRQKQLNVFRV